MINTESLAVYCDVNKVTDALPRTRTRVIRNHDAENGVNEWSWCFCM